MLVPGKPFPDVSFDLVGGGRWSRDPDATMTVIDLYRGLHCPRCRAHLEEMALQLDGFTAVGAEVVAVSMDPPERAEEARAEWRLGTMAIGYGLTRKDAGRLGGYLSTAVREGETDVFAEPAILYVQPDGTLYGAVYGSFPFARPKARDVLEVCEIVTSRGYPARGTLTD